jgi:predicted alpha/beta hydrolase family esterase
MPQQKVEIQKGFKIVVDCLKNIKVIFIPGNGGSSTRDNWFPFVQQELEKCGIEVIARDFPDSQLAREKYWIPFLEGLHADENTILIGHSSGAIAAMRYAENHKLFGTILVGAYHTDLGMESEKLSGYFDKSWLWDSIRANQRFIALFASLDDPWIPIEEPRYLRDRLNPEYYEYRDQGHFGGDYFKPTFPEIVAVIKNWSLV